MVQLNNRYSLHQNKGAVFVTKEGNSKVKACQYSGLNFKRGYILSKLGIILVVTWLLFPPQPPFSFQGMREISYRTCVTDPGSRVTSSGAHRFQSKPMRANSKIWPKRAPALPAGAPQWQVTLLTISVQYL